MELEAIPGVGTKTAEALRGLDDPERALRDGDVAALSRAPGISEGRAARIARAAIRAEHDDPGGFCATPRARDLYQAALELLQDRAVTDYGARWLETLYPSASESRISEVRSVVKRAMDRSPSPETLAELEGVAPLSPPSEGRVHDRCVATADAEQFAEAQSVLPELSVELVDDARQLAELARSYSTVIALDESFAGIEVEGNVRVEPDALEDPVSILPERILRYYAPNRDRLLAAIRVHRAASLEPPCDLEELEAALDRLDKSGEVVDDEELARLVAAVEELEEAVSTAERVATDHLREAIRQRDVTIEGTDLLSLAERGAGIDSLLSRELAEEYDDAVTAARGHLVDALQLEDHADLARGAFPDEPTFPVEHDEAVVGRLREALTATRDDRATRLKRELAHDLAAHREDAEALVDAALELDVELALARFAADFDCVLPTIAEAGTGVEIVGGRSPLLGMAFEEVEPIDYAVDGVALLSGVNSGGKTSTLDLVALVTILAHMGLPVPAEEATVGRVAELYYHAETKQTLDAGAFESTLLDFGELLGRIEADRPVMVLVDELESITEPGAAAMIIAGILEALADRQAIAVFVTHLAEEVMEAADVDLSVDGIVAVGLEDGELRVERSPVKDTLARSTPELIVEKLASRGEEEEADHFYAALLEKFD